MNPKCDIYDGENTICNSCNYYSNTDEYVYKYSGVIKGYSGSRAEAYAKRYNRTFESLGAAPDSTETPTAAPTSSEEKTLIGDANCDGKVTIADSTAILQALGNPDKYALSKQGALNADCCDPGDGVLPSDALAIQKIDAKILAKLPDITKK